MCCGDLRIKDVVDGCGNGPVLHEVGVDDFETEVRGVGEGRTPVGEFENEINDVRTSLRRQSNESKTQLRRSEGKVREETHA